MKHGDLTWEYSGNVMGHGRKLNNHENWKLKQQQWWQRGYEIIVGDKKRDILCSRKSSIVSGN
jgi:hypothetical protein